MDMCLFSVHIIKTTALVVIQHGGAGVHVGCRFLHADVCDEHLTLSYGNTMQQEALEKKQAATLEQIKNQTNQVNTIALISPLCPNPGFPSSSKCRSTALNVCQVIIKTDK